MPVWGVETDPAMMMPGASKSLLLDVAAAGERLVAVGERGHILYSDNAGDSWTQARVPTSVMLTRVLFRDAKNGWAVGHDGNILFSSDGGASWELQRDGVSDQLNINKDRVSRSQQTLRELRAKLEVASDDRVATLEPDLEDAEYALERAQQAMSDPVYAPPLMAIGFCGKRGWASGGFGVLLSTSTDGRQWEDYSYAVNNDEELHLNGITADSAGGLFIASEWGYIFRSTCSGKTWEAIETGYDGSFFGVVVNPATDSVFAYGLLGTIYRSRDRGATWEELDSGTASSLFGAVATANGALVMVGLNGTAVASRDDGDTFISLELGSNRDLYGVAPTGSAAFTAVGRGGSINFVIDDESAR
ncbi:WD40/YVTN/BNR-like repeat-containing protein [Seongchinamella unica]|nr:YCF48-related protein [Seongchinamella unica]